MQRKTLLGLFGIAGIWITAGLALPFVNVLGMFTPEQLMVFRGFLTALMAFIGLRGAVRGVDRYAYLIAITLPFATLGLFEGIRHWGAGPTIIIITATPLVNFVIAHLMGKKVPQASITGLVLMLGGVVMARWSSNFQLAGFAWTAFGTIMNGILYELFARSKSTSLQKCFWACTGMGVLGLALSTHASWAQIAQPKIAALVVGFAFVGGFLYWLSNLMAFENLPTTEASVLAQGETPAVIIGAVFMLHEHLTLIQWIGVGVALYGAWQLGRYLQKASSVPEEIR